MKLNSAEKKHSLQYVVICLRQLNLYYKKPLWREIQLLKAQIFFTNQAI